MPHSDSALAAAKLEKEQALAKLRAMQTAALEGRLLDREQVARGGPGPSSVCAIARWQTVSVVRRRWPPAPAIDSPGSKMVVVLGNSI
jgi:hypothetical protein